MNGDKGYINPLLTELTVDYSQGIREKNIASLLFPRISVSKPTGEYVAFDKDNMLKVGDDAFDDNGQSKQAMVGGTKVPYSTRQRGLHDHYPLTEAEVREGPFAISDKNITERLVTQLELNKEYRVAQKVMNLAGRVTALAGAGETAANKFTSGAANNGDPFAAIQNGIAQCFYRPNLMIISDSVFDVLEYHPDLLAKLGESNMIKQVNEETLAKLFRVQRVVRAQGKGDASKKNVSGALTLTGLWGNSIIMAYVDNRPFYPSMGAELVVKYSGSSSEGYIVRTWDDERAGLKGEHFVQVGYESDERVVCSDLIYVLKDCI
jgi:hypothetical protein